MSNLPTISSSSYNDLSILDLFSSSSTKPLKIVAPMVRYSKLPFRLLCKNLNIDIFYTPMIMAESFNISQKCRDAEFTTSKNDKKLVVQFGANDPIHFAYAALAVKDKADAVDLNCGCPQKWALKEGIGSAMLKKPQIKECIQKAKELSGLPISIKIRIDKNIAYTLDLIKMAEDAGVSWITIHGRTLAERTSVPVHLDAIAELKSMAKVPIIANGDVFSSEDFYNTVAATNVNGCMIARGMLENPGMFSNQSPIKIATEYLMLALEYGGSSFFIHFKHIYYMLYRFLTPGDKIVFRNLTSLTSIVNFFKERGWWTNINEELLLCNNRDVVDWSLYNDYYPSDLISPISLSNVLNPKIITPCYKSLFQDFEI